MKSFNTWVKRPDGKLLAEFKTAGGNPPFQTFDVNILRLMSEDSDNPKDKREMFKSALQQRPKTPDAIARLPVARFNSSRYRIK